MQILQWLLKVSHEPPRATGEGEEAKSNDLILFKHHEPRRRLERVGKQGSGCNNLNPFGVLRRRDIAKSCFFSTLNLRRIGSFNRRRWIRSMRTKKEGASRELGIDHKPDSPTATTTTSLSGNSSKVLPVNDASLSSSSASSNKQESGEKKDKRRTISKMKELLRWAAAGKSEKGSKYFGRKVLQFRNRVTLKAIRDEDEFRNESPKISFRWDLESCSTISSSYSAISIASLAKNDLMTPSSDSTPSNQIRDQFRVARRGNWITTDSEFVVLEL